MLKMRKISIRRVLVLLGICGLFFFFTMRTLQMKNVRVGARLIFEVRVSHQDEFRLDIDGMILKTTVSPDGEFRRIDFKLPRKEIGKIILFLGSRPGSVWIRKVTLKTLLRSYHWSGESVARLFGYRQDIRIAETNSQGYYMESETGASYLVMARTMPGIVNKVTSRKLEFILFLLVLTGLLFFLLAGIGLESLKIFAGCWKTHPEVALFMLLLFFPLVNSGLKVVKPIEIQEKRARHRKPEFRLDGLHEYMIQYRNYYNDHFVFRNSFIRLTNLISFKLFNRSSVPMVLVGKEGWLFMSRETPRRDEVDYYRSVSPFSREELKQWCRTLNQRHQWLKNLGIHYLLVIVPNKSTIYPEFMPDYTRKATSRSRLDQLLEYVNSHSRVRILDIRDALKKAKSRYPVFYKSDSHWNDYGGYIGYVEIMKVLKEIKPAANIMSLDQFDMVPENRVGGDLAGALSLQKEVIREDTLKMVPRISWLARTVHRQDLSRYVTKSISVCESGGFPTAIMVHDSFIHELRPFLAQHFSRMLFIWDWGLNIYPDIIKAEKPWIVIEEMAERYLLDKILSNPEVVTAGSES